MEKDPVAQNVAGVQQLIRSKVNKLQDGASGEMEGVAGEREDVFTVKLSDEKLLTLARSWETKYSGYETKIKTRQNANKAWYLGQQSQGSPTATNGVGIASNLLFEAVETFLPAALAKNPEPVVWADNSPQGNEISGMVKTMLQYHADQLAVRTKLGEMTRSWAFNFLGVLKYGWDDEIKEIKIEVRNPQNFIFNPEATVDAYGDMEGYVGERITIPAQQLIDLFPEHKTYITVVVDGKLGTDVTYTEWWNDDYCFYTFKGLVLDKNKNPHFNYPTKVQGEDAGGSPMETEQPGQNHFAKPKKPYTFLSVFSLGDQPHDITGLIEQNIPNQNRITKRETQIDVNLDRSNNSIALSGLSFNQETAKQAAMAMQKGNPVLVPDGRVDQAIARFPAPAIPDAFFKASEVDKQDLRSVFGTDGLGTTPPHEQKTLGGLLNNEQHDNSRIGGTIGSSLEVVAKSLFNFLVQFYYVYYDEPHFAAVLGQMKATEYVELSSQNLTAHLIVSVSPDSMKPKDELTQMNQALTLWEQGAIDPKTLLTMLDFPDANETAESTVLWLIDKNAYLQLNFPELAQKLVQIQQAQQPPPGAQPPQAPPQSQPLTQ